MNTLYLIVRSISIHILILLTFLASSSNLFSQELPPVVNYPTEVYRAANQNWAISQGSDKNIYVANNDGLLEFNGASWTLYPSPNNTIVRSVEVIDDRIYTGSYMEFGYWTRKNIGVLVYRSLSQNLNIDLKEDEQFWNITQLDNWVVFQSLNTIYLFDVVNERILNFDSSNTIQKTYVIDDVLYFQVDKEGMYKIESAEKKLMSDFQVFQDDIVVAAFPYQDAIMFITANSGFYIVNDQKVSQWNRSFSDELSASIYSSISLNDGSIMLGTVASGVYILSSDGRVLSHINKYNGLNDNTVLSMFQDKEKNIWLGLDNGIDCINMQTPFRNYIDQAGVLGTVYTSVLFKEKLYLGTNQGLFHRRFESKEPFKLVEGTNGQVWSLNIIDDQLFCGHNNGTFLIDDGKAKLIASEMGTWGVKEIPDHPELLLQGNYSGLYILERSGEEWKKRNKIEGFDISSRYFELTTTNDVLVSHEYKGVYLIDVDSAWREVRSFDRQKEVDKAANSGLTNFEGSIYYGNDTGIYQYQESKKRFVNDSVLSSIFLEDSYNSGKLISKDDLLWAFTENYIHYVKKNEFDNTLSIQKIPIPIELRKEMKGYENVTVLQKKEFLFGTTQGYLLVDLDSDIQTDYTVRIHEVKNGYSSGSLKRVPIDSMMSLDADRNNFRFSYSVPEYEKYIVTQYSYRLEGDEDLDRWSEWSSTASVAFSNLRSGEYAFLVRARVNNMRLPETATYSFRIEKPWHLSNIAILGYILSILFIAFFINTIYTRYYRNQQKRVIEETVRDSKVKELEAQKAIIQLKNESLHQDIEARNRELAIATMSMINGKNKLNTIKDAILNIEQSSYDLKPVIQLINDSLDSTEEWKFFEEAFNHADKDFFKRIKNLHPNLTPNDLKLCVYLRLNLSSKEIAPLLNISPRSVEIKRYRLRKKIGLDSKMNLNDYFIKL